MGPTTLPEPSQHESLRREIVFNVERDGACGLVASAQAGARLLEARGASSLELHRSAREALLRHLGPAHSGYRLRLEQHFPGMRHLRCCLWPGLDLKD